ncbi:methyltransferase domain-containing protein [Candidatus Methylacidiphilum infernorum]|uniref:Methyltransferase domain-containing protein n=1 Tax=Candidatus Methylacidiphilum infernorum TaxID=511746 RepID=A0ABX7PUB8_9BACT|nr:methyltransferase domain-containing protein [Candidatus Methylacidiphilum infernorum]QSR86410.1 methyltransferase domain-containing protein [Candidatus Methylacidiphilum infernorum]
MDLGAGEGSASKTWLEGYKNKLETICSDVFEFLEQDLNQRFDLVCAVGFLHHIEDYLALIQKAVSLIKPMGYFFSF